MNIHDSILDMILEVSAHIEAMEWNGERAIERFVASFPGRAADPVVHEAMVDYAGRIITSSDSGRTLVDLESESFSGNWGSIRVILRALPGLSEDNYQVLSRAAGHFALLLALKFRSLEPMNETGDRDNEGRITQIRDHYRSVSNNLYTMEEKDRRLIACNLHDHIGQALTIVKMRLSMLRGDSIFCGADEDFENIIDLVDAAIRYTRELTCELSPPILYDLGLAAALETLVQEFGNRFQGSLESDLDQGLEPDLSHQSKYILYRAVRETLNNISKHSRADKVIVIYDCRPATGDEDGSLEILIRDNGLGFKPEQMWLNRNYGDRFGLFAVRESMALINGRFEIFSRPGKGTEARIGVTLRAEQSSEGEKRS